MKQRRKLLLGLAASALAPMRAIAQPAKRWRVGWLSNDQTIGSPFFDAFRSGLSDLGYVEGSNLEIDARWGAEHVNDLVRSRPDVIVTQGGTTFTLFRARPTTPVVFGYSGDPVEAGFADSFARPGRNFTGMSFLSLELVGKRMETLKEVLPQLGHVAVLANPQHPGEKDELRASQAAAAKLGLKLTYFPVQDAASLEEAFAGMVKARCEAMDVFPDVLTVRERGRIAEFAIRRRIPSISGWARFAESGNLLSYGPDLRVVYRELAGYVGQIFKGASPAELPIRFPTMIELVVNLKTAAQLGLTIPPQVMLRASKVIE
jgi:putative tryptophan/tyrosine transport system substrate-binding protein